MSEQLPVKDLETILRRTVDALQESKAQMFDIAESARQEYTRVNSAIAELKKELNKWIGEVDALEKNFRRVRYRLYEVSRNFERYSEDEKRKVYEEADKLREELTIAREREKYLRQQRDEQEKSLIRLDEMVGKAEKLLSQVGIALDFLAGNLQDVNDQIETIQARYQIGQRIIKGQEDERKRVAREIHDGPAQDLANVVLKAEICEKLYESGRHEQAMNELRELKESVKQSLNEVRRIIYNLRPMTLDDLGLVPTLKRFMEDVSNSTGIFADVTVMGREARLSSAVEVALFRAVQEGVNNSRKHGKPKTIRVTIEFTPELVSVLIRDDGIGFDVEETKKRMLDGNHFGLFGMRERVGLLGGTVSLESKRGIGTRIIVRIPLKSADKRK